MCLQTIDDPVLYVTDSATQDDGDTSLVSGQTVLVPLLPELASLLELSKETLAERFLAAERERSALKASPISRSLLGDQKDKEMPSRMSLILSTLSLRHAAVSERRRRGVRAVVFSLQK